MLCVDHFYSLYRICYNIASVLSLVKIRKTCGSTPQAGMEPAPPALEGEVLTSGPPGKFPSLTYKMLLGGLLPCAAFGGKHDHNSHFWPAK